VNGRILTLAIRYERDVVLSRQRARQLASLLGFDAQDQTRIATAVSEIARNAFTYAGGGKVEFALEGATLPQVLLISVTDEGPGIAHLRTILEGEYRSETGMGLGIVGARRLMDRFDIESVPGKGTHVSLKKLLPRRRGLLSPKMLADVADQLARQQPEDPVQEIQQQNQELLRALEELARRQEELVAVNRELEDTNRGVVALYAELDERADHLRRADEIKTRFLSDMSHEFRTPVNSIQALARMLLERTDGDLTPEQERQVTFIGKAADSLSELVNDLLDLAKVEAGKVEVRSVDFEVANLFGALRGMLRPLLAGESLGLVFEDPEDVPPLHTDEAKVSQILRNFISNAIKYTDRGEVRVSACYLPEEKSVAFSVADTGIGIAAEDQERIFQEFTQLDSPQQRRVKGTGLGLPLCRKYAELLGGHVELASTVGVGSTFTAVVPVVYPERRAAAAREWDVDPQMRPILVVEDSLETLLIYEKFVRGTDFQIVSAANVAEGRQALAAFKPQAVVLDVLLKGEDTWSFLTEIKRRPDTHDIPVFIVTTVDDEGKGLALGADAYSVKPVERRLFLQTLMRLTAPQAMRRILIVDDEEISRYVLRQHLMSPQYVISEAGSAAEGLRAARAERPDAICLDLMMPDTDGFQALRMLKADPATRDIPVVVVTSKSIDDAEHRMLLEHASAVLNKAAVSRTSALATIDQAMRARGAPAHT
jgi:signal transduction histidine kinase/CheY-like chemotaxis protein